VTRHLVSRGDRLTWCGLTSARIDELTADLDKRTCKDCRTALITRGICPECGEEKLTWGVHPRNKSGVADGRLTMNDVETIFYLGCDFCSATLLAHVDPETVAAAITELHWRP
jgi:hypothetical protein